MIVSNQLAKQLLDASFLNRKVHKNHANYVVDAILCSLYVTRQLRVQVHCIPYYKTRMLYFGGHQTCILVSKEETLDVYIIF